MSQMTCSDCGFAVTHITPAKLAKGSSVREPGEAVCRNCLSSRVLLVREMDAIPKTLDKIKALRAPRIGRMAG